MEEGQVMGNDLVVEKVGEVELEEAVDMVEVMLVAHQQRQPPH